MKENIPLSHLQHGHWLELLSTVNPSFQVPDENFFLSNIVFKAYEAYIEKRSKEIFLPIIYIAEEQIGNKFFMAAVSVTRSGNFYYLNNSYFDKPEEFTNMIARLVNDSVAIAQEFGKNITCILYDTPDFKNNRYYKEMEVEFLKCKTLTGFVEKMRGPGLFLPNLDEATTQVENYQLLLKKFKNFANSDITLSDAMHTIITSVETGTIKLNPEWAEILKEHLNPLMLGCCYLNPKYKEQIMNLKESADYSDVDYMLNEFITVMVPPDAYDHVSYYKDVKKCFSYLNGKHITDPTLYWNHAKREFVKLADLAIDMLSIPAIPRKINVQALHKLLFNSNDKNPVLVKYEIGMLLLKD